MTAYYKYGMKAMGVHCIPEGTTFLFQFQKNSTLGNKFRNYAGVEQIPSISLKLWEKECCCDAWRSCKMCVRTGMKPMQLVHMKLGLNSMA